MNHPILLFPLKHPNNDKNDGIENEKNVTFLMDFEVETVMKCFEWKYA